ncbi:MAG TPA: gephyrin-like molybdotransferase Glp [Patescibacteria group bacterium]|nr:gephyrin-like molybdotransferase Glp [Patescibacteria group bacterium]
MAESEFLTVNEALQIILSGANILSPEVVPLMEGLNRIVATPILAREDLPPFANSAMDGYAVRADDVSTASGQEPVPLKVIGDIAAGFVSEAMVVSGTATRITTGAPLPWGADSVIPVEDTSETWRDTRRPLPEQIQIMRAVDKGSYVRWPGEDVKSGYLVVAAGQLLRPQEIGLLASLGYAEVEVIRQPRVGILATGDELIPIEAPLVPGKIRNSNGYTQAAQTIASHAIPVQLGVAGDTTQEVRERLAEGLALGVDLFVSSAGVSVGAYDIVKKVLEEDGEVNFWRVRMRPGKPLTYGRYQSTPYLGLPGNPVSAMVSFERFARPAILKMAGWPNTERPTILVRLNEEINSDGRESYIRAVVSRDSSGYWAETTGGQGSHMMTSLVKANALLIIPEGVRSVAPGVELTAMMLDWPGTVF